jgi:hypothetical protein
MKQYTVIWRDNGDDYMVTTVELGDVIDARQMSTNEWADLAYAAECKSNDWTEEDMEDYLPSRDGYDLISVIVGVPEYIY